MTTQITADQYDDATQIVAHAIDTSITQNEIVEIEVSGVSTDAILSELYEACDDLAKYPTDTGRIVEYWGRDAGNDWRVHVIIGAETDAA